MAVVGGGEIEAFTVTIHDMHNDHVYTFTFREGDDIRALISQRTAQKHYVLFTSQDILAAPISRTPCSLRRYSVAWLRHGTVPLVIVVGVVFEK